MKITAAVSRGDRPSPALEQLELEEPRAGEMRIRLVATGICHTDLHEHPGRHSPHPIVLGHEGAGVVEKLGEGVTGFEVGDHVILSGNSCGQCPSCLANRPTYCDLAMPLCFGGQRLDSSTSLEGGAVHSHFFGQSSFATHSIPDIFGRKISIRITSGFKGGRSRRASSAEEQVQMHEKSGKDRMSRLQLSRNSR